MRFLKQVVAIIVASWLLELVLPWWSITLGAALCGYLLRSGANFAAGFVGIALLWLVKALLMDMASASDLTESVSRIFMLNSKLLLLILVALIGGLVGGLAAMTGLLLRSLMK